MPGDFLFCQGTDDYLLTEKPLRREPDKHAYPSGQPEDLSEQPEEFPDFPEEIVPLDKDSIMS